jgi:hypothetical protein
MCSRGESIVMGKIRSLFLTKDEVYDLWAKRVLTVERECHFVCPHALSDELKNKIKTRRNYIFRYDLHSWSFDSWVHQWLVE